MKKNVLSVLLVLFIAACGGVPDDTRNDSPDAGVIGEATQELVSQVGIGSCGRFSGVRYENSRLTYTGGTCPSSSSNVYFVPRLRALSFRDEKGTCSDSQHTFMRTNMDSIIAEWNTSASLGGANGWSFSRSSTGTHTVKCGNVSFVGADHIHSYVHVNCNEDTSRTIVDPEVDAILKHFSSCTITVDVPDIQAKGASSIEDLRLLIHALANGMEKLTGTGNYTGIRMAASDDHISPSQAGRVMFSLGERCRARNYSTTQPLNYFLNWDANCADW